MQQTPYFDINVNEYDATLDVVCPGAHFTQCQFSHYNYLCDDFNSTINNAYSTFFNNFTELFILYIVPLDSVFILWSPRSNWFGLSINNTWPNLILKVFYFHHTMTLRLYKECLLVGG
ncbi:hypothetical protein V144x_30020 [Gimesia aquarii]|uniref:Uncharacterized protein n=1 Tax=Gimesia aquarii TaxID=2527964 RepID=A0A517VWZ2_9PLAN|nr:hypothetical protein V144x_30020 [Gimesia aquarii]